MHLDWVNLLHGKRVGENQYDAKCPAHDDQHASLRINTAEPGKTLLHCHAGCTTEAIVAAVGKSMADLFTEPAKTSVQTTRPIATYSYVDIAGKAHLEKRRFSGKEFRWYHETPNGWVSGIGGVTPALYAPMALTDADTVFWVEGEKDTLTMVNYERAAVCIHSGANGKPTPEQLEPLRGKDIVILPDNDEPGRKHAQNVAAALQGIARSVKVLDLTAIDPALPQKGDVSDMVEKHGADILTRVEAMASELPEWKPQDETGTASPRLEITTANDLLGASFAPLVQAVDRLICEGLTFVVAASKIGKSWLVLLMALCVANGEPFLGRQTTKCRVLYFALEDSKRRLQGRLKTIGVRKSMTSTKNP